MAIAPHESTSTPALPPDTVLIVDDEEGPRKTCREWLETSSLGVTVLTASDAPTALNYAQEHTIDLAVLDWNLESGDNGLDLLQDLAAFHPNIVAIMITGYAQEATPLDAMRMGVRDYFEKTQKDLTRERFLASVQKQLDQIRPAKRERLLHAQLQTFRETIEKVLPLVESTSAMNDPLPLPEAISSLFRFLMQTTNAKDGIMFARSYDATREPAEICRAFDPYGETLNVDLLPFSQSLAGAVISMGEAYLLTDLKNGNSASMQFQSFEQDRDSALIAPLTNGASLQVVLELFDKQDSDGFTSNDRQIVEATAEFGGELFRHAFSEQRMQQVLFDALATALEASHSIEASLGGSPGKLSDPPPEEILDALQRDLQGSSDNSLSSKDAVRLAEAVRVLALRHGSEAVQHCLQQIESLQSLLDAYCEMEGS